MQPDFLTEARRCPSRLQALDKTLEQLGGPEEFRAELIKLSEDYLLIRYPDVEASGAALHYDQEEVQRGPETGVTVAGEELRGLGPRQP